MICAVCKTENGVRFYGTAVDGEVLRMQVPLCQDHGDRYLIVVGNLIGLLIYKRAPAR